MFLKTHTGTGNEHKHQQMQLEVPGQKNVSATCPLPREHWESCCNLQHCAESRLIQLQGTWRSLHLCTQNLPVTRPVTSVCHDTHTVFSHAPWHKLLCGRVQRAHRGVQALPSLSPGTEGRKQRLQALQMKAGAEEGREQPTHRAASRTIPPHGVPMLLAEARASIPYWLHLAAIKHSIKKGSQARYD